MNSDPPISQAPGVSKQLRDGGSWFATFSFLDASGSVSSSELRHLAASIRKFWRAITGRLGRS